MRHLHNLPRGLRIFKSVAGIVLVGMLMLTACATSTTGNNGGNGGNGGNNGGTTSAPTATAAPTKAPSGHIPTITLDYCKQLMTVDEANSIMQPSEPATSVELGNPYIVNNNGGACNYRASATNFVLVIYFLPWNGPVPISQSDIQAAFSDAAGSDLTFTTVTPVSGVGTQAEYVEATGSAQGLSATMHIFYVLVGDSSSSYIFDCFTYSPISKTMGTQDQLQQCAQQVYSRL